MTPEPTTINPTPDLAATLAELVAHLKRPVVSTHDTLWTTQDIADWLRLSPDTIERRVITLSDFPPPLQPCQTGQRATRRWFAGEVIQWARKTLHRIPVSRAGPHARRRPQSSRPATSEAVAL